MPGIGSQSRLAPLQDLISRHVLPVREHPDGFLNQTGMDHGRERQTLFSRSQIRGELLRHKPDNEMNRFAGMHSSAVSPVVRGQINRSTTITGEDCEIEKECSCGLRW